MKKILLTILVLICIIYVGGKVIRSAGRSEEAIPARGVEPGKTVASHPAKDDADRPVAPRPAMNAAAVKSTKGITLLESTLRSVIGTYQQFLNLDGLETDRLISIFVEFEVKKSELEASRVKVVSFEKGELKLEIPPYYKEGAELRSAFLARLKEAFPNGRFEQIDDYLGSYFDGYFRGFGITQQAYVISRDPSDPTLITFNWAATVVGDHTPSGIQTAHRWEGGTGSGTLSLDAMESGEYRFLGPVVRKTLFQSQGQ